MASTKAQTFAVAGFVAHAHFSGGQLLLRMCFKLTHPLTFNLVDKKTLLLYISQTPPSESIS